MDEFVENLATLVYKRTGMRPTYIFKTRKGPRITRIRFHHIVSILINILIDGDIDVPDELLKLHLNSKFIEGRDYIDFTLEEKNEIVNLFESISDSINRCNHAKRQRVINRSIQMRQMELDISEIKKRLDDMEKASILKYF